MKISNEIKTLESDAGGTMTIEKDRAEGMIILIIDGSQFPLHPHEAALFITEVESAALAVTDYFDPAETK